MTKLIKIEELYSVPRKGTNTSSGIDVAANSLKKTSMQDCIFRKDEENTIYIQSLERVLIGTGLRPEIEEGFEILVRPRSGLALKKGLTILNSPGTIDEDYKKEIGIILVNLSDETQKIELGDYVAQLVLVKKSKGSLKFVEESGKEIIITAETVRDGGFGSTGK